MLYKFITATLVAASFSVSARAQTITDSDAASIMDNYSSSFNALAVNLCLDGNRLPVTGSTLKEAFTVKQNEVVGLLNRGDRTLAAAKANTMLDAFGYCFSKSDKQFDRPIYAKFMGGFIATDALAYDNTAKMQEAITLLDYAKYHGQENEQFLNLVKEHRAKEAVTVEEGNLNIGKLRGEAQANLLRFKRDYEGKSVILSGSVVSTGERDWPKKSVWITIKDGAPSDQTTCYLTQDAYNAVYDVNKGQSITVEGNVKAVEAIASGNGFYLKSCKVV